MPVIGPQISGHIGSLSGSSVALVVGLAGAVWSGLGVTLAIGNALDHWTATVGLAGAGAIALSIPQVLGIAAGAGSDLAVFLASFWLLTAARVSIRQVLPGAVLASACWLLLQALGGVYVTQVLKGSSQTYGGFAVVVGILTWLLIAAEITLMAAEVNVVLSRTLWPRSLTGDLLPADEPTVSDSAEAAQRDRREHINVTFEHPHMPSDDETPDELSTQEASPNRSGWRSGCVLRWTVVRDEAQHPGPPLAAFKEARGGPR
jgi:membrane protein